MIGVGSLSPSIFKCTNAKVYASLVENDSGDVDLIARKVTEKVAEVAGTALGALVGAPAEAVTESESFKENMATGLAWIFGNILGMGDDTYNADSFPLYWWEFKNSPPIQPSIRRNDDPQTIDGWTHSVLLRGRDDGGDRRC